jgi:hypothetical protein
MPTPYDCGSGPHVYMVSYEDLDGAFPRLCLLHCEACGDPISRWRTAPPIPEAFEDALPEPSATEDQGE